MTMWLRQTYNSCCFYFVFHIMDRFDIHFPLNCLRISSKNSQTSFETKQRNLRNSIKRLNCAMLNKKPNRRKSRWILIVCKFVHFIHFRRSTAPLFRCKALANILRTSLETKLKSGSKQTISDCYLLLGIAPSWLASSICCVCNKPEDRINILNLKWKWLALTLP